MRLRRTFPTQMALGCMPIFTGKRVMWEMLPIGIERRGGTLPGGITEESGRGLWESCFPGNKAVIEVLEREWGVNMNFSLCVARDLV